MDKFGTELEPCINDALTDLSLSEEERIRRIYQNPNWISHVDDRLKYKDFIMPDNCQESLDQLVEWYINKKSRHVKEAGAKLRKVFLELPPVEQRKVGMALLTGGKSDTEWVCQRLDNHKPSWDKEWVINWHPCYSRLVEDAWIRYPGKFCGRLLIQFLDKDVVCKHYEELLPDDELYFGLCRRFAKESWSSVDTERLAGCTSINAYLSILSQTTAEISEKEAEQLLYQWIATMAAMIKTEYSLFKHEKIFWRNKPGEHRVI